MIIVQSGNPRRIVRRQGVCDTPLPEDLHPLLRRLYRGRGIRSAEELQLDLKHLHPVDTMQGVSAAAALLHGALARGDKILIIGDYDADGATSCALAVAGLRAMGAERVDYLVPNRFDFGYGLTPEIVELAVQRQPGLIVTVDNGIASHAGVRRANELGVPVVITDHHLSGENLPQAAAIVNPNQPGDRFPSKHLAGVGVMFYVLAAVRQRLRGSGWFASGQRKAPNLAAYLDLVALGTVADVVPLDWNNRILVEQGLRRIRAGHCRPGIQALVQVSARTRSRIAAQDIGFALGPRLNAAGRLKDMSLGVECLLADDHNRAFDLAGKLDELNRQRRQIEADMRSRAETMLEQLQLDARRLPLGICLYDDSWHQGVIGVLAARIKERYHRPVIAFAAAGDGSIKGSARSVPELHIRDAIDAVSKRYQRLVGRFGGHAMAAGLTLQRKDLAAFADAFDAEVHRKLNGVPPEGDIATDGELAAEYLNLDTALLLKDAGPWGQGFPEPVFDGRFRVLGMRVVGERHLKLRLESRLGDRTIDAIAFNQAEQAADTERAELHIVYRLDVNAFRGSLSPQLIVEHLQWTG